MLAGGNAILTLIAAAGHLAGFTAFGVFMTVSSWYMAEYHLEKDAEKLMSKIEGGE